MWLSWQLMGSGMSCPMSKWHGWFGTSSLATERTHTGTVVAGDLPGPGLVPAATLRITERTTLQRSPAKNSWPGLELPQVSRG